MPNPVNSKRITHIVLFLIVLLGLCTSMILIASKEGMHVDEYYSYGLSNYTGNSIYMNVEPGHTYVNPETPFLDYMTVQSDARFSYENVWEKQSADVHPPFYYVLLHTICSFFPGAFSIWFAALINLIFFAGMIVLTYAVMRLLTRQDSTALLAATFCALSGGVIQINTFLRMYTMLMFFTLLLTWLHTRYYKAQPLRFFVLYPFIMLSGAMTHYYFFIFLCFQGLYFGLSLLFRKRWKQALLYLTETLLTLGVSFAVFPAMGTHIFSGYRGQESLGNLVAESGYLTGLLDFMNIISRNLTGSLLYVIGIVFIAVVVFQIVAKRSIPQVPYALWGMLVISAAGYYLLISKIAVYHYDRYISPIYPVLILLITGMISVLIKACFKAEKLRSPAACLLILTCVATSYVQCDWTYLQKQTKEAVQAARSYENLDCIILNTEVNFWNQTLYYEAKNYQSVTFLSDPQQLSTMDTPLRRQKPVVIYILNIIQNQNTILQGILEQNPSYSSYSQLPASAYARGYLLE